MTWLELPQVLVDDTQLLECGILFLWWGLVPFKVYSSSWLWGPCQELLSRPLLLKKACGHVYVCCCTKC